MSQRGACYLSRLLSFVWRQIMSETNRKYRCILSFFKRNTRSPTTAANWMCVIYSSNYTDKRVACYVPNITRRWCHIFCSSIVLLGYTHSLKHHYFSFPRGKDGKPNGIIQLQSWHSCFPAYSIHVKIQASFASCCLVQNVIENFYSHFLRMFVGEKVTRKINIWF
jgi:hypothetical protein